MEQSLDDLLAKFGPTEQLAGTLERALAHARSQGHQAMTVEHLLLALCDDADASVVLKVCMIDLERLKSDMSSYLQRTRRAGAAHGAIAPAAHDDLVRILRVAHAAAQQRQRSPNGGLVLAAIVGDGRSPAANMLRSQGLTFEAAVKALQTATANAAANAGSVDAAPGPASPTPEDRAGPDRYSGPEFAEPEPRATQTQLDFDRPAPQADPFAGGPVSQPHPQPRPAASDLPPEQHPEVRQPASMRDILDDARRRLEASKPARRESQSGEPLARLNRPPVRPPAAAQMAERPAAPATSAATPAQASSRANGAHAPSRQRDPIKEAGIAPLHDLPPRRSAQPGPPPVQRPAAPVSQSRPHGTAAAPEPASARPQADRGNRAGISPQNPPAASPAVSSPAGPPPVPIRGPTATVPPEALPTGRPVPAPPAAHPGHVPEPGYRPPDGYPRSQPGPEAPPAAQVRTPQPSPVTPGRGGPGQHIGAMPPELKPPVQHASQSLPGAPEISKAVPRTMRRSRTEIIEVRISRRDIDAIVAAPVDPTTGRPVARRGYVVSRAMTLRMRSAREVFHIEPLSPETQWVEQRQGLLIDDSVQWRWAVTPRQKGKAELQVLGAVRTVHSDGQAIDTALPMEKIAVRVRGKPGAVVSALGGFTLAIGVGAAIAVAAPIVWPTIRPMIAPLLGL